MTDNPTDSIGHHEAILVSLTVFPRSPRPVNEAARNEAVQASGLLALTDDAVLHEICLQAKAMMAADWVGVALILDNVQIVIASSGGLTGQYDRERSITAHAIMEPDDVLVIGDARLDKRCAANAFVRVGLIRYFAAAPLVDADGFALGALCASGRTPRHSSNAGGEIKLRDLADQVVRRARNLRDQRDG